MAALMQALRKEHEDMAVLLDLMDRQIAQFQEGAPPGFNLVRGIIGYFLTYPDLYHHPKEDLIAERLRGRSGRGPGEPTQRPSGPGLSDPPPGHRDRRPDGPPRR